MNVFDFSLNPLPPKHIWASPTYGQKCPVSVVKPPLIFSSFQMEHSVGLRIIVASKGLIAIWYLHSASTHIPRTIFYFNSPLDSFYGTKKRNMT